MIYTDDPGSGKQPCHSKRHQTCSGAHIENAIRGSQLRKLYHPHRNRCAQTLREAIELCCDPIIAGRIYFLIIHYRWPMMLEALQFRNDNGHESKVKRHSQGRGASRSANIGLESRRAFRVFFQFDPKDRDIPYHLLENSARTKTPCRYKGRVGNVTRSEKLGKPAQRGTHSSAVKSALQLRSPVPVEI